MELSPVKLKSSSTNSSATSAKYWCPPNEQNQAIHGIDSVPDSFDMSDPDGCEGMLRFGSKVSRE